MIKILFLTIFSCLTLFSVKAQTNEDIKNYFGSPLDIPLILSGTFGELRPNHFHAGIDIKTQGASGLKVYSVADGYVYRIKISPTGYGKAIYIKHPNGYSSVYAHLLKYNDKIESLVRKAQYDKKTFEIELFPKKGEIEVKKGEFIAFSGNTGGSYAPHLHFEIRDSKTEYPQNGMHFGFNIKDDIKPIIKEIKLFEKTNLKGLYSTVKKTVKGNNGIYYIDEPIYADTAFGLGISTYDLLNGAKNKNGVYQIKLFIDTSLIYNFKMKEFGFHETKYIKSHLDFEEKVLTKKKFHKCFVDPNNKLSIYDSIVNNGIISFKDKDYVKAIFVIYDSYNNKSTLSFKVKKRKNKNIIKNDTTISKIFVYGAYQTFQNDYVKINTNAKSFYDLVYFKYNYLEDTLKNCVTGVHQIHNENTPIHNSVKLTIKLTGINTLEEKLCIAKFTDNNLLYVGGVYNKSSISSKIYSFGDYTVAYDTISPKIKGLNIYPGKTMKSSKLKMLIEDEFSGINTYNGKINGEWILMEYDKKNNRLTHYFEKSFPKGKHLFELEVTDNKNNKSTYKADFIY